MAEFDCLRLVAHPARVTRTADVSVRWLLTPDALTLRYDWPTVGIRFPAAAGAARADGLWQHTCGELFIADADATAYREFNFAPSGEWACYDFAAYRQRAEVAPKVPAPHIRFAVDAIGARLDVRLSRASLPPSGGQWLAGVTAVTECDDGMLEYRALTHPAADPDFHDRAGFILKWAST